MAKVHPGKGRSSISDLPEGLQIVIPAKKNFFIIMFLGFWLAGWLFGEITVIKQLIGGENHEADLFLIAWLGMWTIAGVAAVFVWLWNFKGKEIILINSIELQHMRDFVLFRRSKEYEIAHISNLRVSPQINSILNPWQNPQLFLSNPSDKNFTWWVMA